MSGLNINKRKCVGCGLCVKTCPAGALSMQERKAEVNDSCILCGLCIESCRFGALSIQKEEVSHKSLADYSGIWIFAEQQDGKVLDVALELLGKARELCAQRGCTLTAVLLGEGIESEAEKLIAYGADQVLLCDHPRLKVPTDELYTKIIADALENYKPEILLFGATGFGRSLAPRVAARVQTGLTADCTILSINPDTGLLEQTRPAFGGNLMATIVCPAHRPQMATVRPGVMPMLEPDHSRAGEIIRLACPEEESRCEVMEIIRSAASGSIADAKVIVCAGRGIGSQKNMRLVTELAALLGGEVGVTRSLVDMGWAQSKSQIGQTGFVVAPKLLISCGVSGAIQHLAGITGAETVIAINTDPDAPIFGAASHGIVGDCVEVISAMITALKVERSADCQ